MFDSLTQKDLRSQMEQHLLMVEAPVCEDRQGQRHRQ